MKRFPLRIRLTALVTLVFGAALTIAAIGGLAGLDNSLRTDARATAERLLSDYLKQIHGGNLGPATPNAEDATRFVYFNSDGQEITENQFGQILLENLPDQAKDLSFADNSEAWPLPPEMVDGSVIDLPTDSGFVVDAGVVPVTPQGDPVLLERGEDTIAVGLPVQVGDQELTIAVSSPLDPVTNSTNTLTRVLLVLVPTLTGAIALATWTIVGRTLRPVHAITAKVDLINNQNLDQRIQESETDDEIGQLASTMNPMLGRLHNAQAAQHQFISDASHELRSPITASQAALEFAQRNPQETNWPATAELLHKENARLADLVDDFLLLAQTEEAGPSRAESVDLDDVCLTEAQRPHPTPVHVHIDSPAQVNGNLDHLTRAIRNIVDNATRHAKTQVDITITTKPNSAVIEIADDGSGIPTAELDAVFDRFSRLDPSRNRALGGGAGLGWAIAQQIITAHQGSITAANRKPAGAIFTITIPTSTD